MRTTQTFPAAEAMGVRLAAVGCRNNTLTSTAVRIAFLSKSAVCSVHTNILRPALAMKTSGFTVNFPVKSTRKQSRHGRPHTARFGGGYPPLANQCAPCGRYWVPPGTARTLLIYNSVGFGEQREVRLAREPILSIPRWLQEFVNFHARTNSQTIHRRHGRYGARCSPTKAELHLRLL